MSDFPILWQTGRGLCTVVGGGTVGSRKILALLAVDARIRLIDPAPRLPAEHLARLQWVARPYHPDDLDGSALVFAATDSRSVNAAVAAEARRRRIPVNVADAPEESDFTLPAVLRRGRLTIAVASGGGSPALCAVTRDHLDDLLAPEWEFIVELAAALRQKRLTHQEDRKYNQKILRSLLDGGLAGLIAAGDRKGLDHLLRTHLGEGYSLSDLGISLPKETK